MPDDVREAASSVLADATCRVAARRVADEIAAPPPPTWRSACSWRLAREWRPLVAI